MPRLWIGRRVPHLLACIDITLGEWQGGYAYDRFDEFDAAVLKTFEARHRTGAGPHPAWAADELGEMWDLAVERYEEGEMMELDNDVLLRLLARVLELAGAVEIQEVCGGDRGRPGCHDQLHPAIPRQYVASTQRDAAAVFDESLRRLTEWVAGMDRNGWPAWTGTGGRIAPDYAICDR